MDTTTLNNNQSQKTALKTLIVDDEDHARETLELLLSNYSFIQIEGVAPDVDSAIPILLSKNIDVVFLDVEMPKKTGFDLIETLNELNIHPKIIFITAYQKYAMKAIKCGAFDFLLKPFDKDDISDLMARLTKEYVINEENASKMKHLLKALKDTKRIRFNTRHGFMLLDPSEIHYIKAEWNYVTIYLNNHRTELLSINLGNIEKILPYPDFFRINRSMIININRLSKVDRKTKTCVLEVNQEAAEFKVSSNRLKELSKIL